MRTLHRRASVASSAFALLAATASAAGAQGGDIVFQACDRAGPEEHLACARAAHDEWRQAADAQFKVAFDIARSQPEDSNGGKPADILQAAHSAFGTYKNASCAVSAARTERLGNPFAEGDRYECMSAKLVTYLSELRAYEEFN